MADRDADEYRALTATLQSFYRFHQWQYEELVKPRKLKLGSLSEDEILLVPWLPKYVSDLALCIGMNQDFTTRLALGVAADWGVSPNPAEWSDCSASEFDKVRLVLLQMVREWSSDGQAERDMVYGRIISELTARFPEEERPNTRILVPGCGLGRLVLDLVKKGFQTQGNEFSYHMLLALNFVLNHTQFADHYLLLPYLHKALHLAKRLNQLRPVTIPDVNPLEIHELAAKNPSIPYADLMSMTAGSFTDLYGPPNLVESESYSNDAGASDFRHANAGAFDVVATTFFLDTALNIIDYIKTIHHCLKPGGLWVNFGPLLWHFEDDPSTFHIHKQLKKDGPIDLVPSTMRGLELSREELVELVQKVGFDFEIRESDIESTYSADVRALGGFVYKCEYWVARRRVTD